MTENQLGILSAVLIILAIAYFTKLLLENELVDLLGFGALMMALGVLIGRYA